MAWNRSSDAVLGTSTSGLDRGFLAISSSRLTWSSDSDTYRCWKKINQLTRTTYTFPWTIHHQPFNVHNHTYQIAHNCLYQWYVQFLWGETMHKSFKLADNYVLGIIQHTWVDQEHFCWIIFGVHVKTSRLKAETIFWLYFSTKMCYIESEILHFLTSHNLHTLTGLKIYFVLCLSCNFCCYLGINKCRNIKF